MPEPKITFRIIRRCNFDCPGCCTFSSLERKGAVSLENFKRAIDILSECEFQGTLNVSGGETILHEDLPAMLEYASRKLDRARIALFTNGEWVGSRGWEYRLKSLFTGTNVLIHFSHDSQHTRGRLSAVGISPDCSGLEAAESERQAKARLFRDAMLGMGARPGVDFDFAFKGTIEAAENYMKDLGPVPVYLIRLREDPENTPKEYGFMALDVQEDNQVLVYPTLGHIPTGEPLGGLDSLPEALAMNRAALKDRGPADEQHHWTRQNRD